MPIGVKEIQVPAIYEINAIKKRCRKPTNIGIVGQFKAPIKTADSQDVIRAFSITGITPDKPNEAEIYLIDGKLYQKETRYTGQGITKTPNSHNNPFYQVGRYSANANWPKGDASFSAFDINDPRLIAEPNINDAAIREHIKDNRDSINTLIQAIAADLLLVGDTVYRRSGEPFYHVVTFGIMPGNSSTARCVGFMPENGKPPQIGTYFNALQLNEANEYADRVANRRGDPKFTELNSIIVHDPAFVTVISQTEKETEATA